MLAVTTLLFTQPIASRAWGDDSGNSSAAGTDAFHDIPEITVTARKRTESIEDVPISVTAFGAVTLDQLKIDNFDDYATKVPDLSFSYGTGAPGVSSSRNVTVRGVTGINTTGFYIDDVPVFDSMDPRVVDLERIEVLKGPQGTLFGAGSMGGTVRLVTKSPDSHEDSFRISVNGGQTEYAGTPDYGEKFVLNKVVIPDQLSIRVNGFYDHEGGFLTRTFPSPTDPNVIDNKNDQGASINWGGSIAVQMHFSDRLTSNLRTMFQDSRLNGFNTAYAPLPAFQVQTLTLNRDQDLQELARDRWVLPMLELKYAGDAWTFTSSTSFFKRQAYDLEDSTEATKSVLESYGYIPSSGAIGWSQELKSSRFTEEDRLSFDKVLWASGIVGVYFSHTDQSFRTPPVYAPGLASQQVWPSDLLWNVDLENNRTDVALFGEVYNHVTDNITLTTGARLYSVSTDGSNTIAGLFAGTETPTDQPLGRHTERGVSPKVELEYKFYPELMTYASASRGFRPGGSIARLPEFCAPALAQIGYTLDNSTTYNSDNIWSYEAGVKASPSRNLTTNLSVFQIDWSKIQQVILTQCGLPITVNSGAARIRGAEFELNRTVIQGLDLRLGLGYQDSEITSAGSAPRPVGSRILEVPPYNLTAAVIYHHEILDKVVTTISMDYSRIGNSLSATSTSPQDPLVRPAYDLTNMRVAFSFGKSELSIYGKNLFNARTNLGDISYIGFPQTTASGAPYPRVVTQRPLQIGIQYDYAW